MVPGDMKAFSIISDIINETLLECGVLVFSFRGNKQDIVHHDGDTMSLRPTLTQTNSHIYMLTDTLPREKPDIYADQKNLLLVYPMEVVLGEREKKRTASPS